MRNKKFVLAILVLSFVLSGILYSATTPFQVVDMKGRTITFDKPINRIIALTAADCEILCALGCEDLLVGRGEYCDYPSSILNLPSVQSSSLTNIEQIMMLKPQVLLMNDMTQTKEMVTQLENNGIKVVVSEATTLEGVYESISLIGKVVSQEEKADSLINQMKQTFKTIKDKTKNNKATVYFEVSPLMWGLWTAGKQTFLDDLASICGVRNAFSDVSGWTNISEEQVFLRNPDFIITTTSGLGYDAIEEIKKRPGWSSLKAVRNNKVFIIDPNTTSRPGPRLMEAVNDLYRILYEQ